MAKRRSQVDMAEEAKAKLEKERARLELDRIHLRRDGVKARRKMLSVHRAAEQNRFTNDWIAPATSADSAIVPDLARLNARARQVVRDDAWAKSIVRTFRRNVVGTGITPSTDDRPYRQPWRKWATTPALMDMEHRRTFLMVQQWAMDEVATVGECFVVRWVAGNGPNRRLQLQCFEFEQLDQYKIGNYDTGNEIRHGIEVDINGAPVAYHFYKHHPNDIRGLARPAPLSLDSMRIPASMVSHIYDPERVRQTHGISRLAPVLRKIRDLSEYDAAQLRTARAEASIGLLIKGGDDSEEPLQLDGLNVAYLSDNEDVTSFTPQRPGNTYDPFIKAQLHAIAAGVGLSYPTIARDFSGGSFSSQRQNSIEDRREFGPLEQMLITQLCEPTMEDFVFVWAMQNPAQSGDFFLSDDFDSPLWQGQGHEWVDPEQQGKGIERQMRLRLTTRTREASKLGTTVEELDRELQEDGTLEVLNSIDADGRETPSPDKTVGLSAKTGNTKHIVVTGSPGSGKTTYAKSIADSGDIIFDLDRIAAALNEQYANYTNRSDEVNSLLFSWRANLVQKIKSDDFTSRVIIIACNNRTARDIADSINAELVKCTKPGSMNGITPGDSRTEEVADAG